MGGEKRNSKKSFSSLQETRSKKAIQCLCSVITESRTVFTLQLQDLILNCISSLLDLVDLVHMFILSQFMNLRIFCYSVSLWLGIQKVCII